ncbi:MAG: cell division protein FtsZ [Dysgonamonadaceae bacterium]|jgi:cell division protein FtsZ|nr:cell division protein FtsZ [Dysgonamonadaceae bacterium]
MLEDILTGFDIPREQQVIIKVLGVGGGGGNAVTHMYREGIHDVTFALCNTDSQAMLKSEVPVKVQLGESGLGAGNDPEVARQAAENSAESIKKLLSDGTKIVFITAGMGGGNGTGAAPVIAKIAKDMDILTVAIVTIPFLFEGKPKILQALEGVEKLRKNVDALLVINNEKLIEIYGDMDLITGFKKADSTLTTAAKSISELITNPHQINIDFADVKTTLKDGGVAIMNSGFGDGEKRLIKACNDALNSPLLNNTDVFRAQKILFNINYTTQKPVKLSEMEEVRNFMAQFYKEINVIWGQGVDDTLEHEVKVTVLASGFGRESIPTIEILTDAERRKAQQDIDLISFYYGWDAAKNLGTPIKPKPFVFSENKQLDNNKIIDKLLDQPAFQRQISDIKRIVDEEAEKRAAVLEED